MLGQMSRPKFDDVEFEVHATSLAQIIRSGADAVALIKAPKSPSSIVTVRVPGASSEQCRQWERELNESLAECGCELGSRFTAGAIVVSAAAGIGARICGARMRRFPLIVASAVTLAAAAGKHLALAQARARITRIAAEIEALESPQRRLVRRTDGVEAASRS
jgi:hypothetical protein